MKDGGGVRSPAQSRHIHECGDIVDAAERLPLLHYAAQGGVGSNSKNSVYWVHTRFPTGRYVTSCKQEWVDCFGQLTKDCIDNNQKIK